MTLSKANNNASGYHSLFLAEGITYDSWLKIGYSATDQRYQRGRFGGSFGSATSRLYIVKQKLSFSSFPTVTGPCLSGIFTCSGGIRSGCGSWNFQKSAHSITVLPYYEWIPAILLPHHLDLVKKISYCGVAWYDKPGRQAWPYKCTNGQLGLGSQRCNITLGQGSIETKSCSTERVP
jgi:hypothetical protein